LVTVGGGIAAVWLSLENLIKMDEKLTKHGIHFWLSGLNPSVLEGVRNTGLADKLGKEKCSSTPVRRLPSIRKTHTKWHFPVPIRCADIRC
jgi:hypothetical protein